MGKRVTVPCRVHPDTRDEWHDFVDQSDEWDSVSDLIRGAVHREMDNWYSPQQKGAIDTSTIESQLESLSTEIDHVKLLIQDSDEMLSEGRLVRHIRDNLPTVRSVDTIKGEIDCDDAVKHKELVSKGDIDAISKKIATNTWLDAGEIRDMILRMGEEITAIKIIEGPDGRKRACEVKDGL